MRCHTRYGWAPFRLFFRMKSCCEQLSVVSKSVNDRSDIYERKKIMEIGLYQANIIYGKPNENLIKLEKYLNEFAGKIVILPELFTTGYVFNQRDEILRISENIPNGKSCKKLEELAKKFNIVLVTGIAEEDNKKLYNSAVIISPKGYIGKYKK